jgi:hypothetical protein
MRGTLLFIGLSGICNVASALIVIGNVSTDTLSSLTPIFRELTINSDDFYISHVIGSDSMEAFEKYMYGDVTIGASDSSITNVTYGRTHRKRAVLDCDEKGPQINVAKLKQHRRLICSTGAGLVAVSNGAVGMIINNVGCRRGNDADFSDICSQFVQLFVTGTGAATGTAFSDWCSESIKKLSDECSRGGTYMSGGKGIGARSRMNIKDTPIKNAGCDEVTGVTTCQVINP